MDQVPLTRRNQFVLVAKHTSLFNNFTPNGVGLEWVGDQRWQLLVKWQH